LPVPIFPEPSKTSFGGEGGGDQFSTMTVSAMFQTKGTDTGPRTLSKSKVSPKKLTNELGVRDMGEALDYRLNLITEQYRQDKIDEYLTNMLNENSLSRLSKVIELLRKKRSKDNGSVKTKTP
jgi:hypothetical protein